MYTGFEEPPRSGWLARVVMSSQFEIATFIVISTYGIFAVWMTNSLLRRPEILESPGVVWAETLFLVFFVMELVAKLAVHRCFFFCNADMGWNWLDFLIILFSLVDVGALNFFSQNGTPLTDVNYIRVVRALRISKSLRILRAVRFVSELRVLVNCIVTSFSVLFWCVVLLLLIQAGVSTALVQLVAGYLQELPSGEGLEPAVDDWDLEELKRSFGSVQASMISLFMATTGGVDWGEHYRLMWLTGPAAMVFYVLYLVFFFVAAWNIITSLFMEKAMTLSQPDVETQMLRKHREDLQRASEIVKILEDTDTNKTGTISLMRFKQYMQIPRFRNFFEFRDLEIKDAEMFFRILSSVSNSEDVKYDTFAYGCMRMKGYASSLDVQCLRIELKTMYLNQSSLFNFLNQELGMIKGQLVRHQPQDSTVLKEVRQELGSIRGHLTERTDTTQEDREAVLQAVRQDIQGLGNGFQRWQTFSVEDQRLPVEDLGLHKGPLPGLPRLVHPLQKALQDELLPLGDPLGEDVIGLPVKDALESDVSSVSC